jgi:hypothetical protein
MKLDIKKLTESATEFVADRKRGIYIKRRHFDGLKAWNVRNEHGEYLTKGLEFEPSAGQRSALEFRGKTEFTLDVAFQMAAEYVGKTIREANEIAAAKVAVRGPGTKPKSNFDIYTDDTE